MIQKSYQVNTKTVEKHISNLLSIPKSFHESGTFFSVWVFFHLMNHMIAGNRGTLILTSLYHLHPLCEHVDIRQTFLHIPSDLTRTGNLWFPSAGFFTKGKYKAINTVYINKKSR